MSKKKSPLPFLWGAGLVLLFIAIYQSTENPGEPKMMTTDDEIKIAATVFPVYDIARQVAGDKAKVELILPPGASPHTFDPSPSTLANLQESKRLFAIGQGIDAWINGIAENISGSEVVELDKRIELKTVFKVHEEENDEEDKKNDGFDPHYWLDPNNAAIMANTIAVELVEIDPDNAELYKQNATAFTNALKEYDEVWRSALKALPQKEIITFHDAFFYFADHFGLNVVTTFEPFPGKEPTPSYLQEIQRNVKEYGIRVLFTEPQLHGASLRQFAKDNTISISVLDPLGGVAGRDSYITLIDYNVKTIAKALAPQFGP